VRLAEAGAGEPVLFLHGVAGTHAYWAPSMLGLADRRRVLAPDVPGFGASRPVTRGWSLEVVADAIAEVADAAGAPACDLVGHSLGGALATAVALRHPGLVRRLVLVAPIGFHPLPPRRSWRYGPLTRLRQGLLPIAAILARRQVTAQRLVGGVVRDPQGVDHALARAMIYGSLKARRTAAAGMDVIGRDLSPQAQSLSLPTLVVWGRHDHAVPVRYAQPVLDAIPGSRGAVLEHSGHLPMLDEPDAFRELLRRFILGRADGGAGTADPR
jgi:pimeloyl-ACP methyl ester carboxylesterase